MIVCTGCRAGYYGDDCTCAFRNPFEMVPSVTSRCEGSVWVVSNLTNLQNFTIIVPHNGSVEIQGNLTLGTGVTVVVEPGANITVTGCLIMTGTSVILKIGDSYLPVDGALVPLLIYQNCSRVSDVNVTVDNPYQCQDVSGEARQTDTQFGVLLHVSDNNKCDRNDDSGTRVAIIVSVCVAVIVVIIGMVGVCVWKWYERRQEDDTFKGLNRAVELPMYRSSTTENTV